MRTTIITALGMAASPALAFPTVPDTATRLPTAICYDLSVETVPLGDMSPDDPVSVTRIPLCVDLTGYFDVEAGLAQCNLGPTSSHSCYYPPARGSGYVDVSTGKLTFQARLRSTREDYDARKAFGFAAPWDGGLSFQATYFLDTNWDFRVNQILAAHKADLGARLESLILPSLTFSYPGMRLTTWGRWRTASSPFEVEGAWTSLNPVFAIGYDAANREHDVRIWIDQGEVRFGQGR